MLFFCAALIAAVVLLQAWRWADVRHDTIAWHDLAHRSGQPAQVFDLSLLKDLPEPARRYFRYVISVGAPLRRVSAIRMHGELSLGDKEKPNYLPMQATQILAPPHGLVWKLKAGRNLLRISGSDGINGTTSWVRFWLFNVLPIVRAGGSHDHARSAFGRVVAEAAFWAPAALLVGKNVTWSAVSDNIARATVTHNAMVQTVDITVAEDGRPDMVIIPRWSDANPERAFQVQPFGGYLSDFREFEGFMLPTRVEGGNFVGSSEYFPFYKAIVDDIHFGDVD